MTFAADYLRLDLSALPLHSPEFSAGFYPGTGNNKKALLLVAPGAGNSVVPHVRYAAGLVLTLADGTVVKELGQLVVTSDRVIGIVTHGSAGQVRLDGAAGSVYAFTAGVNDLPAGRGADEAPRRADRPGHPVPGRPVRVARHLGDRQPGRRRDADLRRVMADLLNSLTPESRSLMNPFRQFIPTKPRARSAGASAAPPCPRARPDASSVMPPATGTRAPPPGPNPPRPPPRHAARPAGMWRESAGRRSATAAR